MANDPKTIQETFKFLGNILKTKSIDLCEKHIQEPEFEKYFNTFLILRYLSMSKDKKVQEIATNFQLSISRFPSKESIYRFLVKSVPKQESSFIEYISKKKK